MHTFVLSVYNKHSCDSELTEIKVSFVMFSVSRVSRHYLREIYHYLHVIQDRIAFPKDNGMPIFLSKASIMYDLPEKGITCL